jgi:hypothetical protein
MSETSNQSNATDVRSDSPHTSDSSSLFNDARIPLENRKLRFSINPNLVDKSSDMRLSTSGWVEIEDTVDKLIEAVQGEGWAFSYVFHDGVRTVANFQYTDIIAVDIDGGWNIEEFSTRDFIRQNCAFIYTTPSHSPDEHRFRAVFVTPVTITKTGDLKAVNTSLSRRLVGDPSTTDAARVWFGSQGCTVKWIGSTLQPDVFNELLVDGQTLVTSAVRSSPTPTSSRSQLRFSPDMLVTRSDGTIIRAGSIRSRQYIHCPYHNDTYPSAFIAKNESGERFIRCSSCAKTWWIRGAFDNDSRSMITDFSSFERMIVDIKQNGIDRAKFPAPPGFQTNSYRVFPNNIHVSDEAYLKIDKLEPGITFVKSPKGSGKTTFLSEVIRDAIFRYRGMSLEDFVEQFPDDEHPAQFNTGVRVLLIGHRQALIGDLCSKLELNCYLDDERYSAGQVRVRRRQYGVCLDSLIKVQDSLFSNENRYSIVVIDEVEQVLAHFLSETLRERREELFVIFAKILERADRIVALDADLGWTSFFILSMLSQRASTKLRKDLKTGTKRPKRIFSSLPTHIYLNQWKAIDRKIEMFPNETQITKAFLSDILAGKRVFITSNSKTKIEAIHESIAEYCKEHQISRRALLVTSDNSRTKAIQSFIHNIRTEILNYDVVLTSPSLGTGLDITFDNNAQEVDSVYGLFESRVNTHFDIDQQLSRVRHPKIVRAWVSPEVFSFETEFGVVKEDFIQDQFGNTVFQLGESIVSPRRVGLSKFVLLGTLITMQQRASKNLLRKNFVDLKMSQGWSVAVIPKDELAMAEGRKFRSLGRKLAKKRLIDQLLRSKTLDFDTCKDIEERLDNRGEEVSVDEFTSFQRTLIELYYGEEISAQLIEKDSNWRMRRAISKHNEFLEFVRNGALQVDSNDINSVVKRKIFADGEMRSAILYHLFLLTPVFKAGQFDCSVDYSTTDLMRFGKAAKKIKAMIETHVGTKIGHDIEDKPALYLRSMLGVIGLETMKTRVTVSGGQKTYHYTIDPDSLDFVTNVLVRRSSSLTHGWAFVNREYGFTNAQRLESEKPDIPPISADPPINDRALGIST